MDYLELLTQSLVVPLLFSFDDFFQFGQRNGAAPKTKIPVWKYLHSAKEKGEQRVVVVVFIFVLFCFFSFWIREGSLNQCNTRLWLLWCLQLWLCACVRAINKLKLEKQGKKSGNTLTTYTVKYNSPCLILNATFPGVLLRLWAWNTIMSHKWVAMVPFKKHVWYTLLYWLKCQNTYTNILCACVCASMQLCKS